MLAVLRGDAEEAGRRRGTHDTLSLGLSLLEGVLVLKLGSHGDGFGFEYMCLVWVGCVVFWYSFGRRLGRGVAL